MKKFASAAIAAEHGSKLKSLARKRNEKWNVNDDPLGRCTVLSATALTLAEAGSS